MRKTMMSLCVLFLITALCGCLVHSSPAPETTTTQHTVKPLLIDLPLEKTDPPVPVQNLLPMNMEMEEPEEEPEKDTNETSTEPLEYIQPESVEPVQPVQKEPSVETVSYTDEDLYVLSHVINGEACGYSWEHQIGVGSVVLNRVKDKRFPDTIKDVVFQKGQYACTWDGNYDREPEEQAVEAAKYLLENGSQMPEYVLFQAEFEQANSVYIKIGNTYFCYWKKDVK